MITSATVKDGKLTLTVELEKEPKPSKSGKSLLCVNTQGFQPVAVQIAGKTLAVSVNAYIPV